MRTSQRQQPPRVGDRLGLLTRVAAATLVWFTVVALVLILAPSSPAGAAAGAAGTTPVVGATSAVSSWPAADSPSTQGGWLWPLRPIPPVERAFERPASRFGAGHRGIDLAAEPGQPVLAVADGVVTHSGMVVGRGTVTVLHRSGVSSTYEPVDERILEGASVTAGSRLGVIGTGSHCANDACLHLGARLGEDYLDPLLLLTRARIVLLPLLSSG